MKKGLSILIVIAVMVSSLMTTAFASGTIIPKQETDADTKSPVNDNTDAYGFPKYDTDVEVPFMLDNTETQTALYELIVSADNMLAPGNDYPEDYRFKVNLIRNVAATVYNDRTSTEEKLQNAIAAVQMAIDDKDLRDIAKLLDLDSTETNGETGGYYLVFKGDQNRIREHNRMHGSGNTYELGGVTLSTATPFKIARSDDRQTVSALYPEGEDDYYVSRYNSRYMTVVFTPDGSNGGSNADMGRFDGYVSAYPCEPPQEDSTEYVPVTDKEMKVNRYEEAFLSTYPYWITEYCSYEEIYYHRNMFDCDDWVLVRTPLKQSVEGGSYGVFDEIAVYASESYPFTLGFGVFDLKEQRFYSIDEAWNMDFDDLHDVFVHIAPRHAYTLFLGDADCDDELTIIDVTVIQRSLAFIKELDDEVFMHTPCMFGPAITHLSDYDRDGGVSILDATRIQRALIGIHLYPHNFTDSVKLENAGDTVMAAASASFGEEPVTYCYQIEGSVYAASVYGNDFGRFHVDDVNPEPGNFQITTGYIADKAVELPVTSLTYNDILRLTVTAKDAIGRVSQKAVLYFKNVY